LGHYAGKNDISINKTKTNSYSCDERGLRGSEKAAYYVFWLTFVSLSIFGMLNIGFPPPEINFIEVGFFLPLGMFVLYALFAFYFHIKRRYMMKTRIKELRGRYDLTQEELAKKVGVRRETILFLEKGKYNPSLKLAYDIAKVLKSKIEEVFIFEE